MVTLFRVLLLGVLLVLCTSCRKGKPQSPTPASDPAGASTEQEQNQVPGRSAEPGSQGVASDPSRTESEKERTISSEPATDGTPPGARPVRPPDIPDQRRPIQIADDAWTMHFDAAKAKATAQKKDLLVNFSGSDWCGWCIRLDAEVFGRQEFRKQAGKHFVLVNLDYPRDQSKIPPDIQQQNSNLVEEYGIEGYPTVLLTDAKGRPYAMTGYLEGGVEAYLKHLDELRTTGAASRRLLAEAQATADPQAKARLLDQALDLVPVPLADRFYKDPIDQIVQLDADGQAGLKSKYLFRRRFGQVEEALGQQDYAAALKIVDEILETMQPSGTQAQNVYYARAHALHFLKRPDEEKKALEKAIAAAPESENAENIRRTMAQFFPVPPALVLPGKVITTLQTYQTYLPERAFDGDLQASYFWSLDPVKPGDTFTLILDQPRAVQTLKVLTGTTEFPQFALSAGVLETSSDGVTFERVADVAGGAAQATLAGKAIKGIQIRCTQAQSQGLIIREIVLE